MKIYKAMVSIILVMIITGCGESNGTNENLSTQNRVGTGTIEDPYIVGNGVHTFNRSAYFKIDINSSSSMCNVLVYNDYNLNAFNEAKMYTSNYEEIPLNNDYYSFTTSQNGVHYIQANTWSNENNGDGAVGIYSQCIDSNTSYKPDVISDGVYSFTNQKMHLYEFNLTIDSDVKINDIDNVDYVLFYDVNQSNIYRNYSGPHQVSLKAGINYVMVMGWKPDLKTSFSFSILP